MLIGAIKFFDKYVGGPCCFLVGALRSPTRIFYAKKKNLEKIKNAKKILVIQLWGIGETITTLPTLNAIKKRFPDSEITILATSRNKEVYFENKDVSKVEELDTLPFPLLRFMFKNFRKYDIVVDMEEYLNISALLAFCAGKIRIGFDHGARAMTYTLKTEYNDRKHSVYAFLELAKLLDSKTKVNKLISVNYTKDDEKTVKSFFKEKEISEKDFIVGIAPGAAESASSRRWPKEKYAKLADNILKKYNGESTAEKLNGKRKKQKKSKRRCKIIFIGASDERAMIDEIKTIMWNKEDCFNAAGLFTLKETFCMIKKCKSFVGNDSGPMHIAAAQGVKTIGLFGPNTPIRWAPFGEGNAAVYLKDSCEYSPCVNTHKGEVPNCLYKRSSSEYQKCMKAISADNVMIAFEKINGKK